jgi:hypothetical protein
VLDDLGSFLGMGKEGVFIPLSPPSRPSPRTNQPPLHWVLRPLSQGMKWLGRVAEHSPPSGVELKNAWRYTSILQYVFMAWFLIKHIRLHDIQKSPKISEIKIWIS